MIPMPEPRDVEASSAEQVHHAPRLVPIRPLPTPIAMIRPNPTFDARCVVGAIKYHWFLFVVLGTLIGGSLGAAAWNSVSGQEHDRGDAPGEFELCRIARQRSRSPLDRSS